MTPELTRERLERIRVDFDRDHGLGYSDQRSLLAHALDEPARLAAAVAQERERVVRHHEERARHYRAMQREHGDVGDMGHWESYGALASAHETSAAFFRSTFFRSTPAGRLTP